MSAPDSRKSFLAKLTLCGVAVLAAPGLVWRRLGGPGRPAGDAPAAAEPLVPKPDLRAVARDAA